MATHARTNGNGKASAGTRGKTNGRARKTTNGPGSRAKEARAAKPQPEAMQAAYDAFKEFEGKRYTGMKVGRGHKWIYEAGEWVERKITPDKWEIRYTTPKQRKGKAPEGSGVPVGTAYHWYILAHQTVQKLDANRYSTDMVGVKYKLAHKRADKAAWSASDRAQRKRLIQILQGLIADLEKEQAEETKAAAPRAKAPPRAKRRTQKKAERAPSGERRLAA